MDMTKDQLTLKSHWPQGLSPMYTGENSEMQNIVHGCSDRTFSKQMDQKERNCSLVHDLSNNL